MKLVARAVLAEVVTAAQDKQRHSNGLPDATVIYPVGKHILLCHVRQNNGGFSINLHFDGRPVNAERAVELIARYIQ